MNLKLARLPRLRVRQTPSMHFVYLDESGDPGLKNSPTRHYILAGFSVHHGDWRALEVRLQEFRAKMAIRLVYPLGTIT